MKKIIILILTLFVLQPVFADIMIAEVLYDPINSENGGEAVVLHNNGNSTIDISQWTLATKTSTSDLTLPPDTSILPGGFLLIADSGFSLNKDDSSWPDPYHEESITMSNTDSGIALMNGETVVDAVGWGNPSNFDGTLYEGTPHQGTAEGESLRRVNFQDTNDNSADFTAGTPVFFKELKPLEIIIDVTVNITNSYSEIKRVKILVDDNSTEPGIQIKPLPGETRVFEVEVEVFDQDGFEDIGTVKFVVDGEEFTAEKTIDNSTSAIFRGNVSMEYYQEAKTYELVAVVNNETSKSTGFDYESLAYIKSETTLGFQMVGGDTGTQKVTVKNLGNEDVLLKVKGTDIVNGVETISLNSIEYSSSNFTTSKILTSNYQDIAILEKGTELEVSFRITTEQGLKSGSYNGEIMIKGYT
ncbi:MAG: lamin tail domain-containing protein [archaeon]